MRLGLPLLWLTAVTLAGCNYPSAGAEATPPAVHYTREDLGPVAAGIVGQINLDRQRAGLGPLVTSQALTDIAFQHSEDMIARSYFGHADPADGLPQVWPMLSAAGYRGKLGENLFEYRGSLVEVSGAAITAWLGSREHRRLLLDDRYHFTGVGLMGDGSLWRVTQVFAEIGP